MDWGGAIGTSTVGGRKRKGVAGQEGEDARRGTDVVEPGGEVGRRVGFCIVGVKVEIVGVVGVPGTTLSFLARWGQGVWDGQARQVRRVGSCLRT